MYHKERHEAIPDSIHSVNGLKPHLCALAVDRGNIYPERCKTCESFCKYGQRLLELLGIVAEHNAASLSVRELAKQGQALPTLHQRLKKRKK